VKLFVAVIACVNRRRRNRSRKEREIAPDRFCQVLEGLRCARLVRVAIPQRFAKT
jgi:hypothetical protein